jgi:hypothetical protein
MKWRERRIRVDEYLRETKINFHPFDDILQALGFDETQFLEPYRSLEPLMNYPFPATGTVLAWPCFNDLGTYEPEDLNELFDRVDGDICEGLDEWRAKGEQELVAWWKSDAESPDGNAEADEDVIVQVIYSSLIVRLGELTTHTDPRGYRGF